MNTKGSRLMIFKNEFGGINVTVYAHLLFRVPNPQLTASVVSIILFVHRHNPEALPMPITFLLLCGSQVCSRAKRSARNLASSHS